MTPDSPPSGPPAPSAWPPWPFVAAPVSLGESRDTPVTEAATERPVVGHRPAVDIPPAEPVPAQLLHAPAAVIPAAARSDNRDNTGRSLGRARRAHDRDAGSRKRVGRLAAAAIVILMLGIIGASLLAGRDHARGKPTNQAAVSPSTSLKPTGAGQAPAAATTVSTARSAATVPAANAVAVVPTGWTPYTDPSTGFKIAYPAGWRVQQHGTLTDFQDPNSGTYLRVDHQSPPAATPDGPWYALEKGFASSNPGYQRIGITRTTFHGYDAALWEYTYQAGSIRLHAIDLGMIAGSHGFALNFQTADSNWSRTQSMLTSLEDSFQPPA